MTGSIKQPYLRLIALTVSGDSRAALLKRSKAKLEALGIAPHIRIRGFDALRDDEPRAITWSVANLLTWIDSVNDSAGKVMLARLVSTLEHGPEVTREPKTREQIASEGAAVVGGVVGGGFYVPPRGPAGEGISANVATEVDETAEDSASEQHDSEPTPETSAHPAGPASTDDKPEAPETPEAPEA